jgi:phosphoenolpyruvate carboxylase
MLDVTNRSRVDVREVEEDARALLALFADVLSGIGQAHAAAALPLLGPSPVARDDDEVLAATMGFHLLGLVEQRAAARYRVAAEARGEAESGLWSSTFSSLSPRLSPAAIRDALESVRVEAVFTAHPTEARRVSALEMYREVLAALPLERPIQAMHARERNAVAAVLERLYRSGEVRVRKPEVADERAFVIDVVTRVLPAAVEESVGRMRTASEAAGVPIGDAEPRVSFGTWVGGDRDGHPLVTGEVTRASLAAYRRAAIELQRDSLVRLGARLGLSALRQPAPADLVDAIARLSDTLGPRATAAMARNADEPWRTLVNLVLLRLPSLAGQAEPWQYERPEQLAADLRVLGHSLESLGAERIARAEVLPVLRQVRAFGFHLVALDLRQNSRVHELALDGLLEAIRYPEGRYSAWDEAARRSWLAEEIARGRPFLPRGARLEGEAKVAVDAFAAAADHRAAHGADGLGSLIVSMTREVSDLLAVFVLAREGGLIDRTEAGPFCPLPIVPLFETISDLERAPSILDDYLGLEVVRRGLEQVKLSRGHASPVQQVMVGYSDSNKDGGTTASLRAVQQAERAMIEVGARHGVRLELFHGRGGTLSRGAGPTHRFLAAQPAGAFAGGLRLTEQGETILQKYGTVEVASYNLELLAAGTARRVALDRAGSGGPSPLDPLLDIVAREARRAYEELVSMPGFVETFRETTPIDVIETSGIGSRPSRRTGQSSLADLRAIPWVFAWAQSRFGLTGWYGLGAGLLALRASDPTGFELLCRGALDWAPMRYIVANVSVGVLAADLDVAREYATLVTDDRRKSALLGAVEHELAQTRGALEQIYGKRLEEGRGRIQALLAMRGDALRALHRRQIELLGAWRAGARADEGLRVSLLGTVNAIAAGLRTTG